MFALGTAPVFLFMAFAMASVAYAPGTWLDGEWIWAVAAALMCCSAGFALMADALLVLQAITGTMGRSRLGWLLGTWWLLALAALTYAAAVAVAPILALLGLW